jgi:hypothetical protein
MSIFASNMVSMAANTSALVAAGAVDVKAKVSPSANPVAPGMNEMVMPVPG